MKFQTEKSGLYVRKTPTSFFTFHICTRDLKKKKKTPKKTKKAPESSELNTKEKNIYIYYNFNIKFNYYTKTSRVKRH